MLNKQAENYLLIQKSAEISPCEIRSLLEYDRCQCVEESYLNCPQAMKIMHQHANSCFDWLISG